MGSDVKAGSGNIRPVSEERKMKIFITGTSRGLGAALACKLANKGHVVYGLSRSGDMPENWSSGFKGKFWKGDVSSRQIVSDIASELKKENKIPDVFVFNAASIDEDVVNGKFNADIADKVMRVNCIAPFLWIDEFLPDFLKRKQGMFVAISSLVSYRPLSKELHSASYVASKAALSSAFEFFRMRYIDTGVRFLTFHFGRFGKPVKGVPCMSYDRVANLVCQKLENPGRKDVFDYPKTSSILYRFSRLLPDRFWSNFIRETQDD
jgi:3-oxoacyl-[acyl-carrier protein] reductase